MNKELMKIRERELAQHSFAIWGKIAPELFTFERRDGKGTVGHG